MLAQNFLGLHTQRGARELRGDEGIAVAVAADPGTELDEARNRDHRIAVVVFAVGIQHRAFEVAIVDRDRFKQAALKIVQAHLDFVDDGRLAGAHLVGHPQRFDLQLQRVDQVVAIELAEARIGEPIDNLVNTSRW